MTTATASVPEILRAAAELLWPLIVAALLVVVLRPLVPELRRALSRRGFSIKVAGFELSVQEANEQLQRQLDDLREELSALGSAVQETTDEPPLLEPAARKDGLDLAPAKQGYRRVLWVDDRPEGNAYELASLAGRGVSVDFERTTDRALRAFTRSAYDVVVTDIGREERGRDEPTAGLALIREIRQFDSDIPIFVYTTPRSVERYRERVVESGANALTSSSAALLELLLRTGPKFSLQFERLVESRLQRVGRVDRDVDGIDFAVTRNDRLVLIESKAWTGPVSLQRIGEAALALAKAARDRDAQAAAIVTPEVLSTPTAVAETFQDVDFVTLDGLEAWVEQHSAT